MSQSVTDWIGPAILRYHRQHRSLAAEWVKSFDPAQVIKFDSYRRPNDPTDHSQIQAIISDRAHRIVVLFDPNSTTAKEESTKEPLTSHLRCILAFQSYRFALVPSLSLPKAPSSAAPADLTLVLQVREWTFMGGSKSEPEYYEKSRMLGVGGTGGREDWEIEGVVEKWVGEFRRSQESQPTPVPSTQSYPQPALDQSTRQNQPQSKNLLSSPRTICSIVRPLLETATADPLPPGHNEADRAAWIFEIAGGEEGRKEFESVVAGIGVWGMDVDGDEDEESDEDEKLQVGEKEQPLREDKEDTPSTTDEEAIPWSPSPTPASRKNEEVSPQREDTSMVAATMPTRSEPVCVLVEERLASPTSEACLAIPASSPIRYQARQATLSPILAKQESPTPPPEPTHATQPAEAKDEESREPLEGYVQTKILDIPLQPSIGSSKQDPADMPGDSDEVVGASLPDEQSTRPSLFDHPSPDPKPVIESLCPEATESLEPSTIPAKEEESLSRRCRVRSSGAGGRQSLIPMARSISPPPAEGSDAGLRPLVSALRQGANDDEDEQMNDVGTTYKDVIIKQQDQIPQTATGTILAMDSDATASGQSQSQSQGESHPSRQPPPTQCKMRRSIAPRDEPTRIPRPIESTRTISTNKTTSSGTCRQPDSPAPPPPPGPTKKPNHDFSAPTFASSSKNRLSISKEDRRRSVSRQAFTPMPIPTANQFNAKGKGTESSSITSQLHTEAPLYARKTVRRLSTPHTRRNQLTRESMSEDKPERKRRMLTIELEEEEDGLLDSFVQKAMRLVKKEEGEEEMWR